MAGVGVGALGWERQGQRQEGTLHLAGLTRAVATALSALPIQEDSMAGGAAALRLRKWKERKRLFDPGGSRRFRRE
eukprot:SAG11_NODE_446_length_9395_cov_19.399957_5_plen_76_part_00